MADKENNGAQNIDGVLEQLKKSYSDTPSADSDEGISESVSDDVSHDELQAMLKSQFLGDDSSTFDSVDDDDYFIDEEFLNDASVDTDDYVDDADFFGFVFKDDQDAVVELEAGKENDYGLFEEDGKDLQKIALEEEIDEEVQDDKEATLCQRFEEGYQEEYQGDEEIFLDEGPQTLQEEEHYEAPQEVYAPEEDQEIQEGSRKSIQIIPKGASADEDCFDDEDDSLWNESENYTPITFDDVDESNDESTFEFTEDTRTDAEKSADHYVAMFYRQGDDDLYKNVPFKDRILENAPTVESLEAELNKVSTDGVDVDEALDADASTGQNNGDNVYTEQDEEADSADNAMDGLDRSDVALLLEFGYGEDVLRGVSNEQAENFLNQELLDDVMDEQAEDGDSAHSTVSEDDAAKLEKEKQEEKRRFEKLKAKLNKQYDAYRKKRSEILIRFIISAMIALGLFVYELIAALGVDAGGLFNLDVYYVAYALVGLQILIFVALPAIRSIYESIQRIFVSRIDAYFLAGVSLIVTVIYDVVAVFNYKEVPPTFHFCAALVIVFAELSELMRLISEMKGFEYYFLEYLFDDVSDMEKIKYTVIKSEGKSSIAEKMYAGGLDEKTEIYFPQPIETAGGFFDASDVESRKNRATFGWIAASVIAAFIFTIVSGIIYEEAWIAAAAFVITFNLMMPITALVTEWLPFFRLSRQNYSYGAAFASEGSVEQIDKCDMLIFSDMHAFELCDAKSVNLAIYDSTPKDVLLGCLNSIYSEIGGPLQGAFTRVKVKPLGKCRINRVAKSGVEAVVGSGYSVLIGDEAFMARYGITFPNAALTKLEDKIFTLCISINNRVTARIAVKYKMNEAFYNIIQKLTEDKIYCAVQTYDPMVSAELIARVRPFKGAPINVVHKSASDYELEKHKHKASALYSVMGEDLCVMARGSRLNLAVAISNAKKLAKLRKILNICSASLLCIGGFTAMMLVLSEKLMTVSWLTVFLYWIIGGVLTVGLIIWKFPQRDRFIFKKK